MSTRSRIGVLNPDGSVTSVYCHWDGYPEWNGVLLRDYYSDAESVAKLVSMGSISALRKRIEPTPGEKHTFDDPLGDVTISYHRDRGEKMEKPQVDPTVADYIAQTDRDAWEEYVYLWDGNKWKCWVIDGDEIDLSKIGDDD